MIKGDDKMMVICQCDFSRCYGVMEGT